MSIDTDGGTGKPAVEGREHVLGVVARCPGVPQTQPRDAVRVDVLGSPLELGEDRQLVPRALGVGVRHLEQHRSVALHDQRSVSHNVRVYRRPP
jgi:hypothetical protein